MLIVHPGFVLAKISNDPKVEQWAYTDTGIYNAWEYATGSKDVVVAIIDNGFDTFHPDLDDNIWVNKGEIPNNKIDDDKNGYIDDMNGWNFWDNNNDPRPYIDDLSDTEKQEGVFNHGTIVAGIIGAKGNNGRDGAGINWDVQLMNLKVLGNNGSGNFEGLPISIRYAVDNGADVINISMVGEGDMQGIDDAIDYAYAHDVVVVAAAGNSMTDLNTTPMYPICVDANSTLNSVVGVSAIDKSHHLATFSNVGSTCIDITAPGVGIFSTVRFSPTNGLSDTYSTKGWSGTSFATPFVSGAAALIKSINPSWSASKIFEAIVSTVQHTPGQDETGYSNLFGSGLLQVDKAVKYAQGIETPTKPIQQITSTTPAQQSQPETQSNSIIFVSPGAGKYEQHFYASGSGEPKLRASFLTITDINFGTKSDGETVYVTLKKDAKGVTSVYLYDQLFRFVESWSVAQKGDFTVHLADSVGNDQLEIILTPTSSSTEYMYIYTLDGVLQKIYTKKETHNGCTLDVVRQGTGQKDDVALLCVNSVDSFIEILNSDLTVSQSFLVKGIEGGQLSVFDTDNDGINEYIVGARAGRQQFVRIFESTGAEILNFRAYPTQYKGGFDFLHVDYNGDGTMDFVLAPHVDGMPVRVLDSFGKTIESWWPFGSGNNAHVFILPS